MRPNTWRPVRDKGLPCTMSHTAPNLTTRGWSTWPQAPQASHHMSPCWPTNLWDKCIWEPPNTACTETGAGSTGGCGGGGTLAPAALCWAGVMTPEPTRSFKFIINLSCSLACICAFLLLWASSLALRCLWHKLCPLHKEPLSQDLTLLTELVVSQRTQK